MHRIFLTVVALGLVTTGSITAQTRKAKEDVRYDDFKSSLGVFAMNIPNGGSYGLQYERWFNDNGIQVTGGGYYSPKKESWTDTLDYSIMIHGLHTVYGNTVSNELAGRLYTWAAIGHHGFIKTTQSWNSSTLETDYDDEKYSANAVVGLGIGIEVILFEHFSIPLQFGFVGEFPNEPGLGFSFGSGIRYRY